MRFHIFLSGIIVFKLFKQLSKKKVLYIIMLELDYQFQKKIKFYNLNLLMSILTKAINSEFQFYEVIKLRQSQESTKE